MASSYTGAAQLANTHGHMGLSPLGLTPIPPHLCPGHTGAVTPRESHTLPQVTRSAALHP